jgi:glutaredoxin
VSDTTVSVYTRADCHLCAEAIGTIRRVSESVPTDVTLDIVDVDEDPDLRAEYGDRVPYVFVDGRPAFKYRIDAAELRRLLA